MQQSIAHDSAVACCSNPVVFNAPTEAKIVHGKTFRIAKTVGTMCRECGQGRDIAGATVKMTADELAEFRVRSIAVEQIREGVRANVVVTTAETMAKYPNPFWLSTMGFARVIAQTVLAPLEKNPADQRPRLREIIGLSESEHLITIDSAIGKVTIDSLYLDHLYEIDPDTGRDRIDSDHVEYSPLINSTLSDPLEVYLHQPSGKKSQKTLFLALYVIDSAFVYHVVVLTRQRKLLTSFRLNGGSRAFVSHRHGVPLFAVY